MSSARTRLAVVADEVGRCEICPRLVAWRNSVVPRSGDFQPYRRQPLAGFGDPDARLLIVGLAPAAHGGNRTGRVFTGDRSGDFLFAALHRAQYANQPESTSLDDGLELRDVFVTAAVRCAPPQNKPTPAERDACAHYLRAEIAALERVAVVLALGAFGFDATLRILPGEAGQPRPNFSHGVEVPLEGGRTMVGVYHPSQRNVFTGRLTAAMFDDVLERAKTISRQPRRGA
jgi:uracil-DNA glycosylase family 4